MKFNSVKEYFYKLTNMGYQAMMVPLILFIFFYARLLFFSSKPLIENTNQHLYWLIGFASLGVLVLTSVHVFSYRKAKAISREVGLGIKLEKLGTVLVRHIFWQASVVTLMPVGLVLTGNSIFSIAFAVCLLFYFLNWPTPKRVARLLALKGDERTLVLNRGEGFM